MEGNIWNLDPGNFPMGTDPQGIRSIGVSKENTKIQKDESHKQKTEVPPEEDKSYWWQKM